MQPLGEAGGGVDESWQDRTEESSETPSETSISLELWAYLSRPLSPSVELFPWNQVRPEVNRLERKSFVYPRMA